MGLSAVRRTTSRLLVGTALLAASCASAPPWGEPSRRLERASAGLAEGEVEAVVRETDALLVATREAPETFALQRFFAAWLRAQAHAEAAARTSSDACLVAVVHDVARARMALAELSGGRGAEPVRDGVELLPAPLRELGAVRADENLSLLLSASYAGLGFRGEASRALERTPELLRPEAFLATLERLRIPAATRPRLAAAVFDHLRASDEERAYRFAVLAVEGRQRFGAALPVVEVDRIEDWIVDGASVQFVCPRSQTPYLRGETRSPVSGVPHYDYVPVERGG